MVLDLPYIFIPQTPRLKLFFILGALLISRMIDCSCGAFRIILSSFGGIPWEGPGRSLQPLSRISAVLTLTDLFALVWINCQTGTRNFSKTFLINY